MSLRSSRIPHPPGGRIFLIHHWVLSRLGFSVAAVLGAIDFLDRAQPRPGQFVCSRARLIADLEGLVGKNKIDEALAKLIALGWLRREEETILGPRNLQIRHQYALCADAIADFLTDSGIPGVPEEGSRQSRGPGRQSSQNWDAISKHKELEEAACKRPESVVALKAYSVRASGIAGWYESDHVQAEAIEHENSAETITAAITSLAITGKDPLLGLVVREIDRQRRALQMVERRAAAQVQYAEKLARSVRGIADQHEARCRGEVYLHTLSNKKKHQQTRSSERSSDEQ